MTLRAVAPQLHYQHQTTASHTSCHIPTDALLLSCLLPTVLVLPPPPPAALALVST
ncbi:hypothetical protein AZE42_10014 [Rhizopogon vesiculosus]|uniref:Uncharacterized protein n=1 Tax=Rhizopogon vesiculosus TaxID=180088 RepID=A0A1J8QFS3_9AGAM|nr:hypothetical protein AZE42_10014 [Rhizopogon vesiculosus]